MANLATIHANLLLAACKLPYPAVTIHHMSQTKFGTFAELMEITMPEMRPIAERLREIVLEVDPGAVEVVRLGDRAATYGLGPKKMSEGYAYILPYTNWVNLGFYQGFNLPDPDALLQGTGKKLRHIKMPTLADTEHPTVRTLIVAALDERKQALSR